MRSFRGSQEAAPGRSEALFFSDFGPFKEAEVLGLHERNRGLCKVRGSKMATARGPRGGRPCGGGLRNGPWESFGAKTAE